MVKDALRWASEASNDGMKAFANSDGALDTGANLSLQNLRAKRII